MHYFSAFVFYYNLSNFFRQGLLASSSNLLTINNLKQIITLPPLGPLCLKIVLFKLFHNT